MKPAIFSAHPKKSIPLAKEPNAGAVPGWPKVLCIDDDPEISRAISLHLRKYEVQVLGAYHGMHGYWLAVTEKPDCIITDMNMPQGDGSYLLDCLKHNAATAGIPVIVLTGMRNQGLASSAQRRGAECLLTKPARIADLVEQLARHVTLRERSDTG